MTSTPVPFKLTREKGKKNPHTTYTARKKEPNPSKAVPVSFIMLVEHAIHVINTWSPLLLLFKEQITGISATAFCSFGH